LGHQIYGLARGKPVRNIVAEKPGDERPEEILLVGAHYESVLGSPGAQRQRLGGGGPAGARAHPRRSPLARRLRFVAFVNEEPPFSQTAEMGSVVHANAAGARGERLSAMLSLETIGYYSDAPGSQPVQRMESRGACVALRLALIARRIRPLSGKIGKYCGNRGSCLPPRG
jgi:hypothetical protein